MRSLDSKAGQDALVGQRLGEYIVRRRIGSGGMGVVYEGEHPAIGHRVAIKLIHSEPPDGTRTRDLLFEARAASAIHHRGIIDIFSLGHQPGIGEYLVMEYLQGRPLDALIQERAPLPPTEALALLDEVLDALSAAHAVGVIHRDLKPSNIFVVRQSNGSEYIKVLDFGLAKRTQAPPGGTPSTHSHVLVGTPQYMAPEQILCQAVGPGTDLYAVGLVAFELLTGRHPFPGRSPMETMTHHLRSPPPAPSSLAASLPPGLDDLLLRLLAKEPSRRPASASEVARELKALVHPPSHPKSATAPRVRVAAGAVLASALGVLAFQGFMRNEEAPVTSAPARVEPAPPPPAREPSPEPPTGPVPAPAVSREAPPREEPAARPKKHAPARKKEAPQAPAAAGALHLVMKDAWAEVWVDGQKLGSAPPCNHYPLPSGEHELELRNPAFKPYRRRISIPPGAPLTHPVLLEPSAPGPLRGPP